MVNFSAVRPESLAGKIVRWPFRALPRNLVLPILQGPLRGKKWIVGSHLHGCWLGSYEKEMQERLTAEIRPGCVFLDAGANVGFYTLLCACKSDSVKVYAIEPLPANIAYLCKHLRMNGVSNVEIIELAISDRVGTAFFEQEATRAMGKLGGNGNLRVSVSSVDALLQEQRIAPPDVIKMDIEGVEFRALLGAQLCFARYKPALFLATHGRQVEEDCCRLLASWNYKLEYLSKTSVERAELLARSDAGKSDT